MNGWTEQAVRDLLLHTRGQMNGSPFPALARGDVAAAKGAVRSLAL